MCVNQSAGSKNCAYQKPATGTGEEARRGGATGKTARGAVQDDAGGTGHMTIHCSMVLSFPPTEIRALSLCRKERRVT